MVITNRGNGTINEGTGGVGTRFIAKRYPNEEGLEAGTTVQVPPPFLEAEDDGRQS